MRILYRLNSLLYSWHRKKIISHTVLLSKKLKIRTFRDIISPASFGLMGIAAAFTTFKDENQQKGPTGLSSNPPPPSDSPPSRAEDSVPTPSYPPSALRRGGVKIGGSFELIDHHGNPRSDKDFHGHWVLVYFGFTHCPDVCPEQLDRLLEALAILDTIRGLPPIQPLFITVDPERDTPEKLKLFLEEFSPRIIGLTGTPEQIRNVAQAYHVYYANGPKDEENDYIVDHTIMIYLLNPQGQYVDLYSTNVEPEEMVSRIAMHIGRYNREHGISQYSKVTQFFQRLWTRFLPTSS